jgi:hypothetical protein
MGTKKDKTTGKYTIRKYLYYIRISRVISFRSDKVMTDQELKDHALATEMNYQPKFSTTERETKSKEYKPTRLDRLFLLEYKKANTIYEFIYK